MADVNMLNNNICHLQNYTAEWCIFRDQDSRLFHYYFFRVFCLFSLEFLCFVSHSVCMWIGANAHTRMYRDRVFFLHFHFNWWSFLHFVPTGNFFFDSSFCLKNTLNVTNERWTKCNKKSCTLRGELNLFSNRMLSETHFIHCDASHFSTVQWKKVIESNRMARMKSIFFLKSFCITVANSKHKTIHKALAHKNYSYSKT